MSRELPEFENTSGIQPGPLLDTTNIYAKYSTMLNALKETTTPIAQSLSDQQAERVGQQAGQNPSFQPTLSIGRSSQIYNEAGLAANKVALTSQAIQDVQKMQWTAMGRNPDGTLNPDSQGITNQSIQNFQNNIAAYSEGKLQTIPLENRNYFTQLMAAHATDAESHLASLYNSRIKAQTTVDMANAARSYQTAINQGLSSNNPMAQAKSLALSHEFTANVNQLAQADFLDPSFANSLTKNMQKNTLGYTYLSTYNHMLSQNIQNAEKYRSTILASPQANSELGTSGVKALNSQMIAMKNSQFQALGLKHAQYTTLVSNLHKQMSLTGQVDPAQLQQAHNYAALTNNISSYNQLQNELDIDKEVYGYNQEALTGPRDKLMDLQNTIQNLSHTVPLNDPNYNYKVNAYNNAGKLLANTIKKRLDDGGAWAQQLPSYQTALALHTSNPVEYPQSYLDNTIINSQKADNAPPSSWKVQSIHQSQEDGKLYNSLAPSDRVNQINEWYAMDPTYAEMRLREIQKYGQVKDNLSAIHQLYNDPQYSALAPNLVQSMMVPSDYYTQPNAGMDSLKTLQANILSAAQQVKNAYIDQGLSGPQFEKMLTTAANFAFYQEKTNNVDSKIAQQQALSLLTSPQSVHSYNTKSYLIFNKDSTGQPIDPTLVQAGIQYYTNKILNSDDLIIPKGMNREAVQIQLAHSIRVKNNGIDGYELTDAQGNPLYLRNDKGQIYSPSFTSQEVQDNKSELNKGIVNDILDKYDYYNDPSLQKYINTGIPSPGVKRAEDPILGPLSHLLNLYYHSPEGVSP